MTETAALPRLEIHRWTRGQTDIAASIAIDGNAGGAMRKAWHEMHAVRKATLLAMGGTVIVWCVLIDTDGTATEIGGTYTPAASSYDFATVPAAWVNRRFEPHRQVETVADIKLLARRTAALPSLDDSDA